MSAISAIPVVGSVAGKAVTQAFGTPSGVTQAATTRVAMNQPGRFGRTVTFWADHVDAWILNLAPPSAVSSSFAWLSSDGRFHLLGDLMPLAYQPASRPPDKLRHSPGGFRAHSWRRMRDCFRGGHGESRGRGRRPGGQQPASGATARPGLRVGSPLERRTARSVARTRTVGHVAARHSRPCLRPAASSRRGRLCPARIGGVAALVRPFNSSPARRAAWMTSRVQGAGRDGRPTNVGGSSAPYGSQRDTSCTKRTIAGRARTMTRVALAAHRTPGRVGRGVGARVEVEGVDARDRRGRADGLPTRWRSRSPARGLPAMSPPARLDPITAATAWQDHDQ